MGKTNPVTKGICTYRRPAGPVLISFISPPIPFVWARARTRTRSHYNPKMAFLSRSNTHNTIDKVPKLETQMSRGVKCSAWAGHRRPRRPKNRLSHSPFQSLPGRRLTRSHRGTAGPHMPQQGPHMPQPHTVCRRRSGSGSNSEARASDMIGGSSSPRGGSHRLAARRQSSARRTEAVIGSPHRDGGGASASGPEVQGSGSSSWPWASFVFCQCRTTAMVVPGRPGQGSH